MAKPKYFDHTDASLDAARLYYPEQFARQPSGQSNLYRTNWLFRIALHLSVELNRNPSRAKVEWSEHKNTYRDFSGGEFDKENGAHICAIVTALLTVLVDTTTPAVTARLNGSQVTFTLVLPPT